MDTEPLTKWLNKELSTLLECDVGDEYAKNILKIESESEIKEFIGSLLDISKPSNKKFLDDLITKLKRPSEFSNVTVYVKPKIAEETSSKFKQNKNQTILNKPESVDSNLAQVNQSTKKNERRMCECQAVKHKLIGNCLKCGRIVCEEENSGPCYFCGTLVCTKEEREKINRGSNKGEQLKAELLSRVWKGLNSISESLNSIHSDEKFDDDKLKKAIAHKDKLIDYDRKSAKRTQVIDDESDYFNTNSKWLSEQQRKLLEKKQEELNEKRFGSKSNKSYTFDFAGRKIVDEKIDINFQSYAKDIENILKSNTDSHQNNDSVVNQDIKMTPQFIEEKQKNKKEKSANSEKETKLQNNILRLQDHALQEMKDDGQCLSMHQPWASLLVNGIKKHEGRTWYTPYRGRLWIHAGSTQPSECDIKSVETFYKCFYSNQFIEFPSSYPTSCLLGYVDLTDCLSSESYKEMYPSGESDSEYVFICNNPRELAIKIPMSGQHKIFKLDKTVHSTAKKTSVRYNES